MGHHKGEGAAAKHSAQGEGLEQEWAQGGVHPLALPESVAVKEAANPSSYSGTFSSASSAQQVKVAAELSITVFVVSL